MANTHLAYPYLAIEKFSGTYPDQAAESFIQLIDEKIIPSLETHLEMLVNWQTTLSGRKRCSLSCSEDQPLSGMTLTLRTLLYGRTLEQTSSQDFQMDETSLGTEWKWNNVLEEMENKIRNLLHLIN